MTTALTDFPSELTTERLLIRMPMPGDGQQVAQAINASLDELKPWMVFAQQTANEQETEKNIREAHGKFLLKEDLRMHIFHKEGGFFIGATGLHRINWDIPKFEIGYWIDSRYAKNGYMTEAVEGVTRFAFRELKAKRVEIRCDSLNQNSRRVPERLGYELEGILKNHEMAMDGTTLRDTCIFAKTAP